ncbi:RI membrane protein [Klebsiella phage BL02]|nr:RI membrane protein [Klebsiella phage BL02]WKC55006.1 hypothetical protein R61_115 [Klebsiella phage R6_1]WKC55385.1 hypothetical protein R21_219 [Klebsiella phage R2_1]WMX18106.1 hypothetical protein [Klebsiella phage KpF2]CAK6606270.1 lysis inhibition [Klebsiella phage vB_Ko_K41P2]
MSKRVIVMNIKRISMAVLFGLLMMTPTTHAADRPVQKEFDDYINAALQVYITTIPPSVNTSELFYNYMERKWRQKQCRSESECAKLGIRVAYEFASIHRS